MVIQDEGAVHTYLRLRLDDGLGGHLLGRLLSGGGSGGGVLLGLKGFLALIAEAVGTATALGLLSTSTVI